MKWEENIELREYVIGLRREFHRFPELSGEEKETAGSAFCGRNGSLLI